MKHLLLNYFKPKGHERILILEGGDGSLAKQLANLLTTGKVLTLTHDSREVARAKTLLASTKNAQATTDVLPPENEQWDVVVLQMPKGRRCARALLVSTWQALIPGGQLFIIGPSQSGVNAVITDAERLFGNALLLGYKSHQRVARCVRGDRLPDPLPEAFAESGIAPGTSHLFEMVRPEGQLTIETHPGIFSWDRLDEGTALLLETLFASQHTQTMSGMRIWDVGCGAGILGLAAARAGAAEVLMSDVNLLAVRYALRNAERNNLADRVRILAQEGISPEYGKWDLVVSNPTFHQGQQVDTSMADQLIRQAPAILREGGRLLLVANRFLNYDKRMKPYFRIVTRLADTPSFHVIEAK